MGPKIHKSKISNTEWGLVIGLMACIDLIQFILDVFAVGLVLNSLIDIAVAFAFPLYLMIRGEKMSDPKRLLAFLGTGVAEMIPLLNGFPLWTGDAVYNFFLARWRNRDADNQEQETAKMEQQQKKRIEQERTVKLEQVRRQQQQQKQIEAADREREAQERYEEAERAIGQRSNQEEYEHLMNMGRNQPLPPQRNNSASSNKQDDVALPS